MIKLLIGGSPCTYWSIAQTANRETEASGLGWELFRNYLIAKEKWKPDYFLYENNKSASKAIKDQIKKELGVTDQFSLFEPDNGIRYTEINSALVSAQNRQRFYVTNFGDIEQPEDRGILLKDVLDGAVAWRDKSCTLRASADVKQGNSNILRHIETNGKFGYMGVAEPIQPLTDNEMDYLVRDSLGGYSDRWNFTQKPGEEGKAKCITANVHRGVPYNVCAEPVQVGGMGAKTGLYAISADGFEAPVYEVKNGYITIKDKQYPIKLKDGYYIIRKLTVSECMRLQTVPEWYVFPVSNSQAYKMLGNGWTVEVIKHLLSHIPNIYNEEIEVLSMYDGMSCGQIALKEMGCNVVKYTSYEIDKYAIQTTQYNFPDTIQMGDAFKVREDGWTI